MLVKEAPGDECSQVISRYVFDLVYMEYSVAHKGRVKIQDLVSI